MKTSQLREFYRSGFVVAFHVVLASKAGDPKEAWCLECELNNGEKIRVHTARNTLKIYSSVDAVLNDCLEISSKKKTDGFQWALHF